jgi:hypothetical protein
MTVSGVCAGGRRDDEEEEEEDDVVVVVVDTEDRLLCRLLPLPVLRRLPAPAVPPAAVEAVSATASARVDALFRSNS